MAGSWHVLHFVGHGGVAGGAGVLALEDEVTHDAVQVSAGRFARLLHACRPVPRLVVLNSCSSGESAADDVLSSTAAALVHSGISAAVAMQFAVTDPAALAFSRGFYQALAHNIAVDEAVRLGRIAIDGTSEQTLEWVTPVVYLRTDDTRLFDLSSRARQQARPPDEDEEISREAAKYGLYVQALAAARNEEFDDAVALLDSVITLDPTYRDAAGRRERIRREQHLGVEYAEARAAEDTGDWEAARRGYAAVADLDPDYRDALARRDACERRLRVSSLQDELRVHAAADDWVAVLAVSDDLARLDPESADPDGLATAAREILAGEQDRVTEPPVQPPVANRGGQEGEERDTQVLPPAVEEWEQRTEEEVEEHPRIERQAPTPPPPPARPWWKPGGRGLWWLAGLGAALVAAVVLGLVFLGDQEEGVTCWDGSSAETSGACPAPVGAEGMATVFPSLDDVCEPATWQIPEGVAEVFDCVYDDYTILYSRWESGADRYAAIDSDKGVVERGTWTIDGADAGWTWTGVNPNQTRERRYWWRATYRDWPYEVLVKGVDEEARAGGVDRLEARPPEEIGLQ
jgi:tetratricopeptide (TPR) repeat protein